MLSLPLGSLGRQWRPVLSCDPDPFTVASFWATWKSIVQGRRALVSNRSQWASPQASSTSPMPRSVKVVEPRAPESSTGTW